MSTNSHIEAVMDQARSLLVNSLDSVTGQLADMEMIEKAAELAEHAHLSMYDHAEVDSAEVIKRLRAEYTVTQDPYTILKDEGKDHEEWWNKKRMELEPLPYWNRYKTYLSSTCGIPGPVVNRLDRLTDRTLGLLEDPERGGEWDRRGLVVGSVQSGKTQNYLGLICKAVDAGYKLVVILAGMHNNLRSQTQLRMDEGFLGFDTDMNITLRNTSSKTGVGLLSNPIPTQAMSLTTNAETGDFKKDRAQNAGIPIGEIPTVLVVKKNKAILDRLISWTTGVKAKEDGEGRGYIDDVPFLLIDDEADNASVNAKKDEVAAINRKIRELLQLFTKSSYIGYTATPFANVFIDPDIDHDELGRDIYPESFIINIPAPSNYFSPVRVFGLRNDMYSNLKESKSLPLIHHINRKDLEDHFPPKHKKTQTLAGLPDDLMEAVKSFYLSIAARRARGQVNVHNSMLVHITRFVDVQSQIKDLLQEKVDEMRCLVEYDNKDFLRQLQEKWEAEYTPVIDQMKDEFKLQPLTWSRVRKELPKAVSGVLPVKAINGSAKDVLGYSENPQGMSVICIGGDKLSRGLTLEGLSVSYFCRPARNYDALMQMGRWFGYRIGYEDLCRLYTTREISRCFEHVTLAREELVEQFERMEATGGSPRDYGNSVRTSPQGMLITAMGKMRTAVTWELSFANKLVELCYYSRAQADIKSNFTHTDSWLTGLPCKPKKRKHPGSHGHIWNASAEDIIAFLSGFSCTKAAWRTDANLLARYIQAQKSHKRLKRWVVALFDPSEVKNKCGAKIGGVDRVGMISRSDDQEGDVNQPYTLTKNRLGSAPDEALGLDDAGWQEALEKTRDSGGDPNIKRPSSIHMKGVRHKDGGTGLLMLYLLDPRDPGNSPILTINETEDVVEGDLPRIGYAVSFPPIDGEEKLSLKVTKDHARREFYDQEEEEDED